MSALKGWNTTYRLLQYALAVGTFACAILIAYNASHDQEKSLSTLVASIITALMALASVLTQRIQDDEKEKKEKERQALLERLDATVTGGESFAAVYFPTMDGRRFLVIRHFGEQPLSNIRIAIRAGTSFEFLDSLIYPTLPPHAREVVKPFDLKVENRLPMQIDFKTLNQEWIEVIICWKVDNDLLFALNVSRFITGKGGIPVREMLHEEVHPRFPRDANGNVDWGFGKIDLSSLTVSTETPDQMIARDLQMLDPITPRKTLPHVERRLRRKRRK